MEESSSVVKLNPIDIKVLIELMEDGPLEYYSNLDSKKKLETANTTSHAKLWETVSDINKSRSTLKDESESTIRSALIRLKRNYFVEEEKIETRKRSKGAAHYRITQIEKDAKKLIRELFSILSDTPDWPRIGYELLRTPWMRGILTPDFIKEVLISRGLHIDEIEHIKSHEALYVILQCTPSGLIRFLREDLWSPSGNFGISWEERKYPNNLLNDNVKTDLCMNTMDFLIHYLTFDTISDLHRVRRDGGVSPFDIRSNEHYGWWHHRLTVLKVSVGSLIKNILNEKEILDGNETTLSAITIDGSQLAIHAYFDSESPTILGEDLVEIGGDEKDVYATFRWLERDPSLYNNWKKNTI